MAFPGALVRIKHVNLPRYELSISLTPCPTGTSVSWSQVFENRDFAAHARSFLEAANEQNLDHLEREVASALPAGA
ncbi:MAG TPA: hypothetical protein VGM13_14680 [Thermoanaerobaculia bacterium]|jgi:hypothetical protein